MVQLIAGSIRLNSNYIKYLLTKNLDFAISLFIITKHTFFALRNKKNFPNEIYS